MQSPPPVLLPLLRSAMVGELLAWLFLHPEREFTGAELAKRIGTSPASTSREADRLVSAGLVRERRLGNLRLLRAETASLVAKPLQDLLAVTYGPLPILTSELGKVRDVVEAYIYGSSGCALHVASRGPYRMTSTCWLSAMPTTMSSAGAARRPRASGSRGEPSRARWDQSIPVVQIAA